MFFMVCLFLFLVVIGLAVVSSSASPNYGAFGLVVVAGGGYGFLVIMGSSLLALILFLIYLGGILVVFAYSVAYAASLNSSDLQSRRSVNLIVVLIVNVLVCCFVFGKGSESELWLVGDSFYNSSLVQESAVGVAFLYSWGGGFLLIGSLALLVALLVLLIVVRGTTQGALRAV